MNPTNIQFTRYLMQVEIRFTNGLICCEWCNMSYVNMKRHFECSLTHEEIVSPKDSIGWDCPVREQLSGGEVNGKSSNL